MRSIPSKFYVQWRTHRSNEWALEETGSARPAERWLQSIWAHQRIKREGLRTTKGEALCILHPGFWNCEAGPDFSNAIIRIGGRDVTEGDIEIDVVTGGWKAHGHDRNPDFRNVVLHVVWECSPNQEFDHPTLELKSALDAPLAELSSLLDGITPPPLRSEYQGKCNGPLKRLPNTQIHPLLDSAALVRLELRASQFRARARQVGWEQSLIEGLFGALGYKNNKWPMRRLAELLPTICSETTAIDPLRLQAILLGIAGMIPNEIKGRSRGTESYLRKIWNTWWRERDRFVELRFPKKIWKMRGLRPANHPQRRVALAAHWMGARELVDSIECWFEEIPDQLTGPMGRHQKKLLAILTPTKDSFWQHHWTFQSKRTNEPHPLLGASRLTDLAINVILPWFFTRAVEGKNAALKTKAEQIWLRWPKAADNAVLRRARARLLGNAGPGVLKTAAHQQGLIQIVRDHCDHSNAICDECSFPNLVRAWHSLPK